MIKKKTFNADDSFLVTDSTGGAATTVTFKQLANLPSNDNINGDDESVEVRKNSIVNVNIGASILQDVAAYESATVNVNTGAVLSDDVVGRGSSQINFMGGTLAEDVETFDSSKFSFTDGSVRDIIAQGSSSITIDGGIARDVKIFHSSTANIKSGQVRGDLEAGWWGSSISVTGGTLFTDLTLSDQAIVAYAGGIITFTGTQFFVDDVQVLVDTDYTNLIGTLSGTLQDGTPFAKMNFDTKKCGCGGGTGTLSLKVVPEPSSFLLSSILMALGIWSRRRPTSAPQV